MDDLVNRLTQELASERHALHKAQHRLGTLARSLEVRTQELAQTRAALALLLATLDTTDEGLLAMGRFGRTVHFNARFAQLWRLAPDRLPELNDAALLALQLAQVCDPEGFLAEVESRRRQPALAHEGTVRLTDGRTLLWRTLPQRVRGRAVGSVNCYREMNPSHTSFAPVRNMPR